ncbi:MAG: serine O-acetyltransferase EpsC [Pseudomonadota bacterium]|nr:serine O-acetyltransferase EpsC [Pseudomonadota bacterium]
MIFIVKDVYYKSMVMSKNFFQLIFSDLYAAKKRDPAARSVLEIFFTYSGFHATIIHRFCHILWKLKLNFLARFFSNISRILTSIEIHPAAKIGEGFFIDHGSGLVIGETSRIGKNVTIYQQATLGGLSPSLDSDLQRNTKRHPTIQDNVIIGSGAQILGPVVIGKNSRIGANAVVLKDVPENITYVGIPARRIESKNVKETFDAYGISKGKMDDPNKKSILALFQEMHSLNQRIDDIKQRIVNHDKLFFSVEKNKRNKIKKRGLK